MILAMLLAGLDLSPETVAVMDRAQKEAAAERAVRAQRAPERALPLPPEIAERLQSCLDHAIASPVRGVEQADAWLREGGGFSALQCRGFAQARAEQWGDAARSFAAAAKQATAQNAPVDAARLWAQAGNAALAGDQPLLAIGHFDIALGPGAPDGLARGEAHLDRARAHVALGQGEAARYDLDQAVKLAPLDPLAWLLSATLARRTGDVPRAQQDIAQAVRLAGDDPAVMLEQGHIALLAGDEGRARIAWAKVVAQAPDTAQAHSAQAALDRLVGPPVP